MLTTTGSSLRRFQRRSVGQRTLDEYSSISPELAAYNRFLKANDAPTMSARQYEEWKKYQAGKTQERRGIQEKIRQFGAMRQQGQWRRRQSLSYLEDKRFAKTQRRFVYPVPSYKHEDYAPFVRRAARQTWANLPQSFRSAGIRLWIEYGWEGWAAQGQATPARPYWAKEPLLSTRDDDLAHILGVYESHKMTRIRQKRDDDTPQVVRDIRAAEQAVFNHLANRAALRERYNEDEEETAQYRIPFFIKFTCLKIKPDTSARMGDKHTHLMNYVLNQNDAKSGECVFQALIDQFANSKRPIKESVEQLREITGIKGWGVSVDELSQIEERFIRKAPQKNAKEHRVGFAVYDARLKLRRLPPFQKSDHSHRYFCHLVSFNNHAYTFKSDAAAKGCLERGVGYFQAVLQAVDREDSFEAAYELFRETQHLQPDTVKIGEYLDEKFGVTGTSSMVELKPRGESKVWRAKKNVPGVNRMLAEWMDGNLSVFMEGNPFRHTETWYSAAASIRKYPKYLTATSDFEKEVNGIGPVIAELLLDAPWDSFQPVYEAVSVPRFIPAKGLAARSAALEAMRDATGEDCAIEDIPLTFPKVEFSMDDVVSMDIETCSVRGQEGRFMTYAVGWRFGDQYWRLVAESEADLETNAVLWQAIQEWQQLATEDKPIYVYAHNGSRFDAVAAIHSILEHSPDVPTDQLESNGKFISFAYRNLIFRDSCLIVMSSLKSAANSYGIESCKGYLPHGYLQNCESATELLERIHSKPSWDDLEPYMDWFHDVGPDELHERKVGRTWEMWRDGQECRKEFLTKRHEVIDFRTEMEQYLEKDVACLHELVQVVGTSMAEHYGANIKTKCTIGSIAEHVWLHTVMKKIPKLPTEAQHQKWQHVNRGGFCGPLGTFDTTCAEGENLYKVDVTSLYPASAAPIEYTTEVGVQRPLEKWYSSFPDPTNGWLERDFGGVEMGQTEYDELAKMHGLVRIEFDQTALKFPFFLKKMQEGPWQTLAPVLKGSEYYTIPHVRMAYDHGVKIKLFDCDYCAEACEPFKEYMDYFAQMKNEADASKKANKELLKTEIDPAKRGEYESLVQKAEFDRTLAKLLLNSLIGRINMKIERPQTMITKDGNDVCYLLADRENFDGVQIDAFEAGEQSIIRAKFKEGDYQDHIKSFNVAPYLSAYVLGYSKMLMQVSFQQLAEAGAVADYTDTDSIVFRATPGQYQQYADLCVPVKKTFGGMELEGTYKRCLKIGPKKYACIHENGDYEWHANGLPARSNVTVDIVSKFERVLGGKVEDADYFSITAGKDFELRHTTGAKKKLRFICLKGKAEGVGKDLRIKWWDSQDEFRLHAAGLRPIGWDLQLRDAQPKVDDENETPETAPQPTPLQKVTKRPPKVVKKAKDQQHFVYVLKTTNDNGNSYVGYSTEPERRLRQHNGELAGGAAATRGREWESYLLYGGFTGSTQALKFEAALQELTVSHYRNREPNAQKLIACKHFANVHKIDFGPLFG